MKEKAGAARMDAPGVGGAATRGGEGPTAARGPQEAACLDCGAPRMGAYCQACGQRHGPPVQPVSAFFAEALQDLGGWDGRIVRTVEGLLLHPGRLTAEYLRGRHTRYLPPFRLYLVTSVVYFAVFFATGSTRFFFLWIGSDDPNVDVLTFLRRMPQAMFVLVPVFALLVALLYRSRRRLYSAHLVFALHFHAFAFLVLTLSVALQPLLVADAADGELGGFGAAAALLAGVAEAAVPVYLYLSLRGCYGGSRVGTGLRAGALILAHMILLATASLLTVPPLRDIVWESLRGR